MVENVKTAPVFKTAKLSFSLGDDGIYRIYVKENADLEIEDVLGILDFLRETYNDFRAPLLIKLGNGSSISREIREYLSNRESRISIADAFVIDGFAHRLLLNFYLRYHKPTIPTAVFEEEESALDWLSGRTLGRVV